MCDFVVHLANATQSCSNPLVRISSSPTASCYFSALWTKSVSLNNDGDRDPKPRDFYDRGISLSSTHFPFQLRWDQGILLATFSVHDR